MRSLYRRIRRSRAVGGAVLRTRARVSRGPQRTILGLRMRLEQSLDSGQAAVDLAAAAAAREASSRGSSVASSEEGVALDLQLQLMESEADPAVLAADLPGDRARRPGRRLVRRLRAAVASGLAGLTDDTLTTLGAEMDREVAALHAGVAGTPRLNRRDDVSSRPGRRPIADPRLRRSR